LELWNSAGVNGETGDIVMRKRLALLAVAYFAISAVLLTVAYQVPGPVTTQKTDRVAGASNGSKFLVERFAG
jgi:hypothetical protein